MTINEKAKKAELPVEKVAELALAAGIDAEDKDRKLEQQEAMKLGTAVNQYIKAKDGATVDGAAKVRFWSVATRHLIQAKRDESERIELKNHVLVLDEEMDAEKIKVVRSLRGIVGRYGIYEVINKGLDEDSDEAVQFGVMLEDIVFTGHNREQSKAGMKAVRALFSAEELEKMGAAGFDPRRLVMKALRNKSLKLVSNNA